MSAYEPVHDPAVHGHAYAVRVPGQDTQPFTAVRPADLPPCRCAECQAGRNPVEPCRCDQHKYGQTPSTDAVLYSGPDAVMLLTHGAIRDGRYRDIGAEFDEVQHGIHADFDAQERRRARAFALAWRAWQRHDDARKQVAA